MNKDMDISEAKARKLLKKMCEYFDVSICDCFFVKIPKHFEALGWYSDKKSNMPAYIIIDKTWTRRLIIVIHELCHHLQEELYERSLLVEGESMHGKSFQLAKGRVATYCRKNISDKYDWEYMIRRNCQGKYITKKERRKGKRRTTK